MGWVSPSAAEKKLLYFSAKFCIVMLSYVNKNLIIEIGERYSLNDAIIVKLYL